MNHGFKLLTIKAFCVIKTNLNCLQETKSPEKNTLKFISSSFIKRIDSFYYIKIWWKKNRYIIIPKERLSGFLYSARGAGHLTEIGKKSWDKFLIILGGFKWRDFS